MNVSTKFDINPTIGLSKKYVETPKSVADGRSDGQTKGRAHSCSLSPPPPPPTLLGRDDNVNNNHNNDYDDNNLDICDDNNLDILTYLERKWVKYS